MTDSSGIEPRLPEEARAEIDALRPRYPTARAILLPALHIAQRLSGGWLPEKAILAVAAELDLAPSEVYGVATFYDLFHLRPVGRHRIRVCTNVSCLLRGSDQVLETLREELRVGEGQITPDGRCSYVQFECLGACEHAPMAMVDDDYRYNLTPEKVRQVIAGLD